MGNVVSSAKTDMFRIRMNPEIREELERIYAKNGLTLTDAVNVFFQQSINAGGFPFAVNEDNAEIIKAKALSRLMKELQKGFTDLADRDGEVLATLAAAYRLPYETDLEKQYKDQVMEANLLAASLIPMQIMETCMEMLAILSVLAEKGSRMAISDVGVGVQFIRASLTGAAMNVFINTGSMKNRDEAERLNERAQLMIDRGTEAADEIYDKILKGLKK